MNSNEVFDAIEEIAATSSKNEKQALVNQYMNDALFSKVIYWAINPLITFGVGKRPAPVTLGENYTAVGEFTEATWNVIEKLSSRDLTGNVAIDSLAFEIAMCGEKSGELLWRIIKKDLRAGFGDTTVNKAVKGLIPTFPYMRCVLAKDAELSEWPWGERPVFSQVKADAQFANLDYEANGIVRISSRAGSEYDVTKFENLVNEVRERLDPDTEYHGELEVYRDGVLLPRQTGNGIINSVLGGGDFEEGDVPVYKIWDCVPLAYIKPKGVFNFPYEQRFARLLGMLQRSPRLYASLALIDTRLVLSQAEAYAHAAELMKQGKEGAVVKHPDLIWKDTGSSGHKHQVKIKLEFEVDLEVVGIVPGNDDTKNEGRAGSLSCKTSDGLLLVNVTVKNEAMRDDVDANPDNWIGSIINVIANDIMLPSESNEVHSLFLPRMAEAAYRKDKSEADTLQHVFDSKEMAILGKSLVAEAA